MMNEYQYLEALDLALLTLSQSERQQLLDDYRRYFRDGRAAGKTDEEIALQLGDPQMAANRYLTERAEYYQYPYQPKKAPRSRWIKVVGLLAAIGMTIGLVSYQSQDRRYLHELPVDAAVTYVETVKPPAAIALPEIDVDRFGQLYEKYGPMAEEYIGQLYEKYGPMAEEYIGQLYEKYGPMAEEYIWQLYENYGPVTEEYVASIMDGIGLHTNVYYLYDTHAVEISEVFHEVTEIVVQGKYNMGIDIIPVPRQDVQVEIYGDIPKAHTIDYSCINGMLNISYLPDNAIGSVNVTIYVPMEWAGTLNADTLTGDIYINDGAAITDLVVTTLSGNISIVQHMPMESLDVESISGNIYIEAEPLNLWVDGVSSDVTLFLSNIADVAKIYSVSGDIVVTMPPDCGFQASTISGDVYNNGKFTYGPFQIETVSGDINLYAF